MVTDDVEEKRDRAIADHVLRIHRYLPPGVEEGTPTQDNLSQSLAVDAPGAVAHDGDANDSSPYQKFDPLLHIGVTQSIGHQTRSKTKNKPKELLTIPFIKKYISYARKKDPPALGKLAAEYIVQVYATIRNEDMEGNRKKVGYLPFTIACILSDSYRPPR